MTGDDMTTDDTTATSTTPTRTATTADPEQAPAPTPEQRRRAAMLAKIAHVEEQQRKAVEAGGKYIERHHARGKLTARERIELLVDEGSAFLELMPLAGWGSDFPVGASLVTGIGVVEGVECMVIANDPTVKGGALNPFSLRKTFRAAEIAEQNHLPTINLTESAGADLPTQSEEP